MGMQIDTLIRPIPALIVFVIGLYIGIKILMKTINNIPLYWDSFAMNQSINILDWQ